MNGHQPPVCLPVHSGPMTSLAGRPVGPCTGWPIGQRHYGLYTYVRQSVPHVANITQRMRASDRLRAVYGHWMLGCENCDQKRRMGLHSKMPYLSWRRAYSTRLWLAGRRTDGRPACMTTDPIATAQRKSRDEKQA